MANLVLASTSPYRRALLQKLGLEFVTASPDTDESPQRGEPPEALVRRLAEAKAHSVGAQTPNALIIGSDQVASIDGRILGKPGNRENAIRQLLQATGKTVTFYTGLCLLNTATERMHTAVETFDVRFRALNRDQIERYVDREQPFNCAGSFKSEGYGITLFAALQGRDPNALVGLPLILLIELLAREGVQLP